MVRRYGRLHPRHRVLVEPGDQQQGPVGLLQGRLLPRRSLARYQGRAHLLYHDHRHLQPVLVHRQPDQQGRTAPPARLGQDRRRRGCLRPGPHPRGRPEGLRLPAGRGQEPVHLCHEPPVADGERPVEALLLYPRSGPRTGPQRELLGRGQAEDRQADLQVLHR